ncbi:hypothetical protein BKG76_13085 [Mycobacteroides franklinii]|uniref:Uncharacterized protein n=1 Tax=Mycobacteroides franklinii TaxID=948102 RepID=A0A1S1LBR6_9MYCO|nr:hypothetical protein [Mycobacteroides franklinii]OHU21550.1 hypothetical protein BKG76_13085 [Mycobacteroides franklinii]
MMGGRLGGLIHGLRKLRQPPDFESLQAAKSPNELAQVALIPAARNLGIAIGFLPTSLRVEATAALLACRVLDAYEDLTHRPTASCAVQTAVDYLNGVAASPPPAPDVATVRDSEAVDLLLARRIRDIRTLLSTLPADAQERVSHLLADIGTVMTRNLDSPLPRTAYGAGVLGRIARYACSLVADDTSTENDLSELAECIGIAAQLANDLRDHELALYGAGDREELTRAVMLRLLTPALGSFVLLARLGTSTQSLGARAATAYMTITTTGFLCTAVGAPIPYRQQRQLGAAILAACSSSRWTAMLVRVRRSADQAIHQMLDTSSNVSLETGPAVDVLNLNEPYAAAPTSLDRLTVGTTFALVGALPEDPLTGGLPDSQVRRMMLADHLAFGALDRLPPRDTDAMHALATAFQLAALDTKN